MVTFVVFAVLVGLAAAYAVRHLNKKEVVAAPPEPQPETATVVVAKINLPKYSRVLDDYVDVVRVPVDKVPEGALQLKSRALFRLVRETILAGQPIRDTDLYAVGEVPMLSERIPPGYRAVTLAVDAGSALNGMIQPESLVDVNLTVKSDRPEIGGLATMTLLRRVRVLATSENRFPASEDRPRNLRNVTLAVTPEQANKLILAQKYGDLSVTLCSSLENVAEGENEVTQADLSGEKDLVNTFDLLGISPIEPEPLPQPKQVVTRTIEVWRGNSVEQVTFDSSKILEAENATLVS
ncbi:MAG: Flp pilus assembly protein CpaB, partial [Planctomycetota bacterium]